MLTPLSYATHSTHIKGVAGRRWSSIQHHAVTYVAMKAKWYLEHGCKKYKLQTHLRLIVKEKKEIHYVGKPHMHTDTHAAHSYTLHTYSVLILYQYYSYKEINTWFNQAPMQELSVEVF